MIILKMEPLPSRKKNFSFKIMDDKTIPNYKFKEAEQTQTFVCDHVFNKERDILYIFHESPHGHWQFTCGKEDHNVDSTKIISLITVVGIDESVNDVCGMPKGNGARRAFKGAFWEPFRA